jgi:hypothetical protein
VLHTPSPFARSARMTITGAQIANLLNLIDEYPLLIRASPRATSTLLMVDSLKALDPRPIREADC